MNVWKWTITEMEWVFSILFLTMCLMLVMDWLHTMYLFRSHFKKYRKHLEGMIEVKFMRALNELKDYVENQENVNEGQHQVMMDDIGKAMAQLKIQDVVMEKMYQEFMPIRSFSKFVDKVRNRIFGRPDWKRIDEALEIEMPREEDNE